MSGDLWGAGIFAGVGEAVALGVVSVSLSVGDGEWLAVSAFESYNEESIDDETFVGKIERFLPEWFARRHATPEAQ